MSQIKLINMKKEYYVTKCEKKVEKKQYIIIL